MEISKHIKLFFLPFLAISFVLNAFSQDGKPADGQPMDIQRPAASQPMDIRANVLRQLGLSPEQIQRIRRVTVERRPFMDEAQKRLREANASLDEAIYADQIIEGEFQARLKAVQLAQAEVAKIRFMNELAVRRILTPEQLMRFRELRQRFEKAREDIENRRNMNGGRPIDRQIRGKDTKSFQDGRQIQRPLQPKPDH